jgi:hypothetical protein
MPEYCFPSFEAFTDGAGEGEGFDAGASLGFGAGFASCCAASDGSDKDSGTAKNAAATTTILHSAFMMALLPIPSYSCGKEATGE